MVSTRYEIRIKGRLDQDWHDWFDDMDIYCDPDDNTVLIGNIADQPALHGILKKIRDLGLTILVVQQISEMD